jgi:hypothetical protein
MTLIDQTDIYTYLKNLGIDSGFFRIPQNARYKPNDLADVLIHASTSPTNSIESAVQDLMHSYPDSKIPNADTIHNYLKNYKKDELLNSFNKMNMLLNECSFIRHTAQTLAIDFHNNPYYGNVSTKGVVGIQPKNSTSWGYSWLTTDIVGSFNQTVDVIPLTGLNKDYSILIEGILHRIYLQSIIIEKILMDREFFNLKVILALTEANEKFIMPAKYDKRMKGVIEEYTTKFGRVPGILDYKFMDKRCPHFYLVLIPNDSYDPRKKDGKDNKKFFIFATNITYSSTKEFIKAIPQEYRIRWNIETGYRMKNIFKIRTCSKSPIVRLFLFLLQCLLHNYLNILKRILSITAYTLKSAIQKGLWNFYYHESCKETHISYAEFYNNGLRLNEVRVHEFRQQLGLI